MLINLQLYFPPFNLQQLVPVLLNFCDRNYDRDNEYRLRFQRGMNYTELYSAYSLNWYEQGM